MLNLVAKYYHWLHGQWPAGHVEPLPELNDDSSTNIPGVYVVGDLKGIPLLKFSIDSGAKAVRAISQDRDFQALKSADAIGKTATVDITIIGAGLSGVAAALEARKLGLSYVVVEGSEPFSTIVNFPKGKPIYTYPKDMTPVGEIQVTATLKEPLVAELKKQSEDKIHIQSAFAEKIQKRANLFEVILKDKPSLISKRVIVAIGRSGNFRKLGVPGEELDKVTNRLHDPKDFAGKKCLVVGGGDSAMETAIALTQAGADVTISYRNKEFARAKPENIDMVQALAKNPAAPVSIQSPVSERITTAAGDFMGPSSIRGHLRLLMSSQVKKIDSAAVTLETATGDESLPNESVFVMIGRDAPLNFFRRSGIRIAGEWSKARMAALGASMVFATALYNWKSGGFLSNLFYQHNWFPVSLTTTYAHLVAHPEKLLGTILISASSPSFWYTLAYSVIVVTFGIKRIRRRKTPYVRLQTICLMSIQVLPLFLLPEIILPWLGNNHLIPPVIADHLFPAVTYGHGREYWRAYGFILAWPLMVYNVFTNQPLAWWLWISGIQTFVIIPGLIYFYGKGAYCGWICSCGALAETLGDNQRTKMPHGPKWNRLNMVGQVVLAAAFLLLAIRIVGWLLPDGNRIDNIFGNELLHHYKWIVDVGLGGIIGYGVYFWYSGRFWCRFFCPLAALMHIYARFSRFGIIAEKKKCISCNVCTSVCHQGIDVMNFANKGLPMKDPECVRCSACVQSCPTGVLSFGQVDKSGRIIKIDALPASPIQSEKI